MTLPLTEKQEEVWRFIKSCERSPSYDEIAAAVGLTAKSGVFRLVEELERRGFVWRDKRRARTIIALEPNPNLAGVSNEQLFEEVRRRLMVAA